MKFIVEATTDIGLRKSTNQDSFVVKVFETSLGEVVLAVLCDGMGGLQKGEVASASVVNAFSKWSQEKLPGLCSQSINDCDIRKEWFEIVDSFNEKIQNYGKIHCVTMGTTVTAMLITPQRFFILNVGDTRAYLIKDTVNQITNDQTVIAREVELGNLTPLEAKTDPRRSVLLQCIGATGSVYPDMFFGNTEKDEVFMLACDGFLHEITDSEIFENFSPKVLNSSEDMKEKQKKLIECDKDRNEKDNITVITIKTI